MNETGALPGPITLLTSIPAKIERLDMQRRDIGAAYVRTCISSWRDAGFRVVTINGEEEAAAIAPTYPDVEIRAVERTALEEYGRPLIYMKDILAQCDPASEALVGIVNADVLLTDPAALRRHLATHDGRHILYGARRDVADYTKPLDGMRYAWGFDYFFLPEGAAHTVPDAGLLFGHNWWDYWFPLALAAQGYRLSPSRDLSVAHLHHDVWVHDDERFRAHYDAFERFWRALVTILPLPGDEPWAVQANALLRPVATAVAAHPNELRTQPMFSVVALIILFYLNCDPNLAASFQDIWQRYIADKFDLGGVATVVRLTRILDDLAPVDNLLSAT
ncbi:MAG TPA: hypothetical protein VMB81_16305 [Candidatus Sulfotelmatobacter sp.]|nr:hypothetical protein [Candidatus Sulfotelmatobacter sp.]